MIAGKENDVIAVKTLTSIHELTAMSITLLACLVNSRVCFFYLFRKLMFLKEVMIYQGFSISYIPELNVVCYLSAQNAYL